MVGLLDLRPRPVSVRINGGEIDVRGVSADGVAYLFGKFPELADKITNKTVAVGDLMTIGRGGAIAAIIAAGCGAVGDEEHESAAASLPLGDQAELLAAILKLTMPDGLVPFVERLAGLGIVQSGHTIGKAPASNSPKPSKR
jgi:hypothetical protein